MIQIFKILLLWVFIVTIQACSTVTDDMNSLIEEDTYINLLAELHLLSAIEDSYPDSTLREEGFDSILLKYNITAKNFEESHDYYLRDVEGQRIRIEEANRRLQEEFTRINEITRNVQEERRLREQEQRESQTNL